ncbi:MAG: phospholipase D-like domain-containing protein [Candidatus Neomarinimicrobiota bacterium]
MQYILILFGWLTAVGVYQSNKPLPEGLNYRSEAHQVAEGNVEFLADLTYEDAGGNIVYEQEIYDTIDSLVNGAEKYIYVDMFLFNSFKGPANFAYRELSKELTQTLISKKVTNPNINIDFITDPVNTFYGGYKAPELQLLKNSGTNVIITDLRKTRDNNYLYSPVWRTFIQWFGNNDNGGKFKNPFLVEGGKVTLRSYLAFGNIKANHRKVVVVDSPDGMVSLITSHNSHGASSDFSNVAFMVKGDIWQDIIYSENAIAKFSGGNLQIDLPIDKSSVNEEISLPYKFTFLTEKKINYELVESFKKLAEGDSLMLATFYLSKRDVIKSILKASKNGAHVRIILDPNKEGFGFEKDGTPNQPVAHELLKKSKGNIKLRWYKTHGEQFHTKLNYIRYIKGTSKVILGNSNLTKKNLGGFNLETELMLEANSNTPIIKEINSYFERIWNNNDGNIYTVEYDSLKNESFWKMLNYRFEEASGIAVY